MEGKWKGKYKKLLLFSIIFSVCISTLSIISNFQHVDNNGGTNKGTTMEPSTGATFDILDFWDAEIERANQTPLNIQLKESGKVNIMDPKTGLKQSYDYQNITFDSPNWVGATPTIIKLHGYLIYPQNKQVDNPAALVMHGLNSNANGSFGLALPYLQKGSIVLCHSHPGHGKSQGAKPTPSNWYYQGAYNKTAHFYLTILGAFQGLRVLENQTDVNTSKIMVTGSSYGAMNTMWLSGIVGDRFAGAVPYIAVGDIKKILEDPTKLIFWVWGTPASEIPESWWTNQYLRFDPTFYLKSAKIPKIFWQFGTNDEYFHRHSINGTLEAVTAHDNKFIQIYANGHHGFPNFENTTKYFIDYVINGGPAPPTVNVTPHIKTSDLLGDKLTVNVKPITSQEIESVEVCFKYIDVVGAIWQVKSLTKALDGNWAGVIGPGIITSRVEYYVIVNLAGSNNVWFTSTLFTVGTLVSNLTVPFYVLIIALIAIPALLLIRRRFRKDVKERDEKVRKDAKKYLIIELTMLAITESAFFISLMLPWAVFESGGIIWTHLYVFNNLYTMDLVFNGLISIMTPLFLTGWVIYSLLSIQKPMFSAFIKFGYPLFVIFLIGFLTGALTNPSGNAEFAFGSAWPGVGVYLMLSASLILFPIGIWKRKYQTKLGIREPKRKHRFSIDRIFKIISPASRERGSKTEITDVNKVSADNKSNNDVKNQ